MRTYLDYVFIFTTFVVLFGFVLPQLFSASSTIAVMIGFIITVLFPLAVWKYLSWVGRI
jgi:hypothetical protein